MQKNTAESERYIFMMFLSGEKIYGFAFEERASENQSALYQEHVDPFLKNASEKAEKIISNCERDLGENVYLKKTVLILNSLYTTESGAIREDFLKQIKKLLKSLDLDNLGYLNFYEVVLHNFAKNKHYIYLEESLYDLAIYTIADGSVKKIKKIAKSQDLPETYKELQKDLEEETETIGLLYRKPEKELIKFKHLITDEELTKLFTKVYFKDKEQSISEPVQSNGLTIAPGFSTGESEAINIQDQVQSMNLPSPSPSKKAPWQMPKFKFNWQMPKLPKKALVLGAPLGLLLVLLAYFLLIHQTTIILETKKENFSSDINFTVSADSSFVKNFQTKVSLDATAATTGEKVTGEKAKGEVTIYNGLFEVRELDEGARFTAANGAIFLINSSVTVPSATTSANLDEGVVTKAFGKKTVGVIAAAIGAESNLDSGAKLIYADLSGDEFYALANTDFSGGVKKTVAVFSNRDAQNLEKKALTMSKNKMQEEFRQQHGIDDTLFTDTISASGVKKSYSDKIDDEVARVTLSYQGQVQAFYAPHEQLLNMVQQQKLKDKEFVDTTFELTNIKLLNQKNGDYSYSAIAKGKVQNLIDKVRILQNLKGKFVAGAKKTLDQENNIISYEIKTGPLPLPVLPIFDKSIRLEFAK